ncbi:MAG: hypothetical protein ABI763_16830 [Bacteroidota bacterium]
MIAKLKLIILFQLVHQYYVSGLKNNLNGGSTGGKPCFIHRLFNGTF